MGKPGRNRESGATFGLIRSRAAIRPPPITFSSRRWRDAGREMKNHNVSHIDGGNFIKLRSSGV